MASRLTKISQELNAQDYEILSRESIAWLQRKVMGMRDNSKIAAGIVRESERVRNVARLGDLYFYYYDPKLKESLPYYDIFPMVLIPGKVPRFCVRSEFSLPSSGGKSSIS